MIPRKFNPLTGNPVNPHEEDAIDCEALEDAEANRADEQNDMERDEALD